MKLFILLELHLSVWSSLAWGKATSFQKPECLQTKPPRLVLGKITTQQAALKMIQRRCYPSLYLLRCSPFTDVNMLGVKWGETFVNGRDSSRFITLLISVLIFVSFCFQSIQLEVQLVHTLVFGKGIHEPV